MSKRSMPLSQRLRQTQATAAIDEVERSRKALAGSTGTSRAPIILAVVAGLMLGLGFAVFQGASPELRLQAYDLFGVGAPRNCEEARGLGIGQQSRGERYYFAHLDPDGDGLSCVLTSQGWR